MLLHLYDISHNNSLSGNFMVYDPIGGYCSAFDSSNRFISSCSRVIMQSHNYFTPSKGTFICEFKYDDIATFWEHYPELLI